MSDEFILGGFRDKPAWHNKGITKVGGWPTVKEGMIDTGVIKHRIEMLPMIYVLPTGEQVISEKRNVLVRAPLEGTDLDTWEEFKTVGKNYNFVSKERIAEILAPLADKDQGGKWPLETIGLLGKADRMLLTLKMESSIVNEDENEAHDHYLFIADDYRGGGSLSVMVTNVRVVCQNTWNMAFSDAENRMSFPHVGDPDKMLEFRIQIEKAALAQRANAVKQFEDMMKFMTDREQRSDLFEAVFPYKKDTDRIVMLNDAETLEDEIRPELLEDMRSLAADDKKIQGQHDERMREHRVNVAALFNKFNDEFPQYANTAYAVLNAVNEYADWRTIGRGNKNRAEQVLYRGRAAEKRRGFKFIQKLMNKNSDN